VAWTVKEHKMFLLDYKSLERVFGVGYHETMLLQGMRNQERRNSLPIYNFLQKIGTVLSRNIPCSKLNVKWPHCWPIGGIPGPQVRTTVQLELKNPLEETFWMLTAKLAYMRGLTLVALTVQLELKNPLEETFWMLTAKLAYMRGLTLVALTEKSCIASGSIKSIWVWPLKVETMFGVLDTFLRNAYNKYRVKRNCWPKVRGLAMNPVEHPRGGGNHHHIRRMPAFFAVMHSPGQKCGLIACLEN
ncbi:hypothetical protein MKX01_035215, partial [Papaver californicum]